MNKSEKLKQFFEQLRGKGIPNAKDIKEAAAATGNITDIIPEITSYVVGMGIDADTELADLIQAREKARQDKSIHEAATRLAEQCGELVKETDREKQEALIANIRRIVSGLGNIQNKTFPTLADIFAEWDSYDPEKDFRPPLLAGVAIKDGTLSYIGARTNVGKTTALISITREALTAGRKVFFLTLEEPTKDILRKLILCDVYANANDADRKILKDFAEDKGDLTADFHIARKGGYVKGEKDTAIYFKQLVLKSHECITGFYGSRLIFCEGRSIPTLEDTSAAVTKYAVPGDIVLVDFVQRLKGPAGTDYTNYTKGKAQSEGLFDIAKNNGIAVISGAQFNRATKDIPNELAPLGFKPFDLTSFRETGDIEQDGDNAFGIGEGIDSESAKRFIKILKVRSGPGRGRCYAIDFQGAFNYMGIGERLTAMNPPNGGSNHKTGHRKKNGESSGQAGNDKNDREGWAK